MISTASSDGQACINFVENFGAQKDTVVTLKSILGGSRIVKAIRHTGDKEYKITEALEVPFLFGNVFVNRKVDKKLWEECCEEIEAFPFGSHDDVCDAISIGVNELSSKKYSAWWVSK
jgi:predicted phage terminase large subunit-like protein